MTTYSGVETDNADLELENMLYAREAEVKSFEDLQMQRGTPIPALFNQFYKFIQNPSSISLETYKRMIDTDDTIGSGVDFLTTCLTARLGMYQHPNNEITAWVNDRLEEIEGGWFNNVKELLSASWAGFAVQEKVWANTEKGFVIKKLVTLPPSTVLFETDRSGDLTNDGILQYQRNYNPQVMSQGIGYWGGTVGSGFGFSGSAFQPDMFAKFGDLPFPMRTANTFNYLSIRIPKLKCVHYAFDAQGKFGNPYGRSLLRRAYKYYVMKDAFLKMLSIALDRKGTPLTIVYADPNTTLADDSKLVSGVNPKGQKVGIRANEAAAKAFANIHNDSTIILPGKKGSIFETDFVPQDAHADQFIAAIDMCNKSILRALLIPALIFSAGDGSGSYALGQEHSKTFEKILDGMLSGVKQILIQQVVKELVAYNFPRELWEKDGFGMFSKRDFSQDEKDKIMDMYEKAVNIGALDMNDLSDLNKIRETIGLDPRDTIIEKQIFGGMQDDMGIGRDNGINEAENDERSDSGNPKRAPNGNKAASGSSDAGKETGGAAERAAATPKKSSGDSAESE